MGQMGKALYCQSQWNITVLYADILMEECCFRYLFTFQHKYHIIDTILLDGLLLDPFNPINSPRHLVGRTNSIISNASREGLWAV